jgi:hypothetical protein
VSPCIGGLRKSPRNGCDPPDLSVAIQILIDNELMAVTAVDGNMLAVDRAQRASYANEHVKLREVYSGRIGVRRGVGGTAAAAHAAQPDTFTRVSKVSASLSLSTAVNAAPGSFLHIDCETLVVHSVHAAGTALRVMRGAAGTDAAFHAAGAAVLGAASLPRVLDADAGHPVVRTTSLTARAVAGAATLSVNSTAGVVEGGHIRVDSEMMLVRGVLSSTQLNVARGELGSAAAGHGASAPVEVFLPGGAAADARPLKVDAFGFALVRVGQSTPFPSAANTISVTLVSNVAVTNYGSGSSHLAARVTLSGLAGAQTPSGQLEIRDEGRSEAVGLFDHKATWRSGAGELVLSMAPDQKMQPGIMYKFSFAVQNAVEATGSPVLHASLHGSAAVGYTASLASAMGARSLTLEVDEDPSFSMVIGAFFGIEDEVMKVVSFLNSTVTVERAQLSTPASAHPLGAAIRVLAVVSQGRALTDADTGFTLLASDGLGYNAGFTPGAMVRVDDEVMLITAREDLELTVRRSSDRERCVARGGVGEV